MKAIEKSDIFNEVLQGIVEFVKKTIDAVTNLVDRIKEKINFDGFDLFPLSLRESMKECRRLEMPPEK